MTELLRHQSSRAYYDNHRSGCMWGLFHLLDFHPRTQSRKMLAYTRHDNGEIKVPTSRQKNTKRSSDKEENDKMEDQANAVKRSSGKAHLLSLLYKKMRKKRDQKLKTSPSSARLLRTISIHHLECNDYVVDETTADNEYPGVELGSQETNSLISSERSYMISKAKDDVGLLSANKELTFDVRQDIEESSQDFALDANDHRKNNTGSIRWKDLKSSIKDVIRDKNNDQLRIALDGILHKVPSGRNIPEYIEKEKVRLGATGSVYGNPMLEPRSIQRSRSLVESLDRYSPLLESISYREPKRVQEKLKSLNEEEDNRRVPRSRSLTESAYKSSHILKSNSVREPKRVAERLESVREDRSLPDRNFMRTFGRILSNPDILTYAFGKDIQIDESHEPAPDILVSKEVDNYVSNDAKSASTLMNAEERTNSDTQIQDMGESDEGENVKGLEQPVTANEQDQHEDSANLADEENEADNEQDSTTTELSLVSVLGMHCEEDPVSTAKYEQDQHEDSANLVDEGNEADNERNNTTMELSLVSVLGTHCEEDPDSTAKYEIIEDAELQQECGFSPENNLGHRDSSENVELIDEQLPIQVDQRYESEFKYVRDILTKSGFTGTANESVWEQFVSQVEEHSARQLEAKTDGSFDTALDRHLMLDLTNEVLVGIFERSIARSTKFTSYDPRIRPMPTGNRLLEDVWAQISWFLSPQQYSVNPLDNIVARDFAKNDGWMDLHWDMESVGLLVEDLVLDELIEEIILQSEDM